MNKKTIGVLGVAAVALVGGTFAYFTQTTMVDNPFDTANYSTVVVEDFKPEDGHKWTPGQEVNKDLYVENTGDRDIVVRVKFEDIWTREDETTKEITNLNSNLDNKVSVSETVTNYKTDELNLASVQLNKTDGETEGDGSVVYKYFFEETKNKWLYNPVDGYFYYKERVPAADDQGIAGTTGKFLDSVRLAKDADMGHYMTQFWEYRQDTSDGQKPQTSLDDEVMKEIGWIKNPEKPQEVDFAVATPSEAAKFTAAITKQIDGKLGYSAANYVLRITIETVQATDKAVKDTFEGYTDIKDQLSAWNLDHEDLEP